MESPSASSFVEKRFLSFHQLFRQMTKKLIKFDMAKQEQVEFLLDSANYTNSGFAPWSWRQLLDFSVLDE
jgi:hypothetical protein